MNVMAEQSGQVKKRIYESLRILRQADYEKCLFSDDCTLAVIKGHSVSRAVLWSIQDNGHLLTPDLRLVENDAGQLQTKIEMVPVGIGRASTAPFVCHKHDQLFKDIDEAPMNVADHSIRDLLLYRAVLRELWLLLGKRELFTDIYEKYLFPTTPSNHPLTRIESLMYLRGCLSQSLGLGDSIGATTPVEHFARKVKSDSPILACSYAYGGMAAEIDVRTGNVTSPNDLRRDGRMEPYTCWGVTVVPQEREHMVLCSWLKGSFAETYFLHIKEAHGRELEAAVSAQLIQFCERWFLNPKVWDAYNEAKREAILIAYNNFSEMLSGKYRWRDRGKQPWHVYADVPNRYQLNMFRYNPSNFA